MNARLLIFILFFFIINSCNFNSSTTEKRSQLSAKAKKEDIVIGVVGSFKDSDLFTEGINLAIKQINIQGGILQRKIKPIIHYDNNDVKKAQKIAQSLANNYKVVAVIGHNSLDAAVATAITYKKHGILSISPENDIIQFGGYYIFRNSPTLIKNGNIISKFALSQGYINIVILYDLTPSGRRLSELIDENANDIGLKIVAQKFYSKNDNDFRVMIADIKESNFDAIVLAGELPTAAVVINQLREMGIKAPIIGNSQLDSTKLWTVAGKAAENTFVSTVFDPMLPKKITQDFIKQFRKEYGVNPDTFSAIGYDAVKLLAKAIDKGDSSIPIVINETLRLFNSWEGVIGNYIVTQKGNISPETVFFKKFHNGNFEFVFRKYENDSGIFDLVEDITIRIPILGFISEIDPGLIYDDASIEVVDQLFLGLTSFDPATYEPVPSLAESYSVNEQGNKYYFHLRKNVYWTDGKPVSAHDVVWSIQRNILPETNSPYVNLLFALKNAANIYDNKISDINQLGVKAIDDYTVVFILEKPVSYFPILTNLGVYKPLPRHIIEKFGEKWTEVNNIQTNGPFCLSSWDKESLMILRKNSKYYRATETSIQEIRYYFMNDDIMGLSMYENDAIDILGGKYLNIPNSIMYEMKFNPVLRNQYHQKTNYAVCSYVFNTGLPPVDNRLVRKAIALSINKKVFKYLISIGDEQLAASFIPPQLLGKHKPDNKTMTFNPTKAKMYLSMAGYPNGKGFPEIIISYIKGSKSIAIVIKICLEEYLNIKVKLKEILFEDFIKSDYKPSHMFRFSWTADYPNPSNFLNIFNMNDVIFKTNWVNNEYINYLNKAESEQDPDVSTMNYIKAEDILVREDIIVVPLYFNAANILVKPRVKNCYYMPVGGQHIEKWYLK